MFFQSPLTLLTRNDDQTALLLRACTPASLSWGRTRLASPLVPGGKAGDAAWVGLACIVELGSWNSGPHYPSDLHCSWPHPNWVNWLHCRYFIFFVLILFKSALWMGPLLHFPFPPPVGQVGIEFETPLSPFEGLRFEVCAGLCVSWLAVIMGALIPLCK